MLVHSIRIAILSVFMLYSSHASKPSEQVAQKSKPVAPVVPPQFVAGSLVTVPLTPPKAPPGAIQRTAQTKKAPSQWSGCKGSCIVQ